MWEFPLWVRLLNPSAFWCGGQADPPPTEGPLKALEGEAKPLAPPAFQQYKLNMR